MEKLNFADYISPKNPKIYLKNVNEKRLLVLNFDIRSARKDFLSFRMLPSTKFFQSKIFIVYVI